jgi:putative protease
MSMRDANRGGCSQSCRWKYELFDMPFAQEHRSLTENGDVTEEFSMSAVDMSMIEHIPDLIENGVDSLKIEGRMKSIHYVSTVANVYKAAVDSYIADPENYVCKQEWIDELWKVAQRELSTGFYYHVPTENEQLFGPRRKIPVYKFIGEVLSYDEKSGIATVRQRNHFRVGDEIEFYGPKFHHFEQTVTEMKNDEGERIDRAPNPMMVLTMPVAQPVHPGDMIRKKKD